MNDLTLLETDGPAPAPLTPETRASARQALLAEIGDPPVTRPRRLHRLAPLALVAASVTAAAVLVPALTGSGGGTAVALVATDPLTFPLSSALLDGRWDDAVFELDREGGFAAARYGAPLDGVSVTASLDGREPDVPDDARPVDLAGLDGRLFTGTVHDGSPRSAASTTVVWETDDGTWVSVRGTGDQADPGGVEEVAESLEQVAQPVDLTLQVAPRGWTVAAYKDDRVLVMAPQDGGTAQDLTVSLLDALPADLGAATGATDVRRVVVHGRDAEVGQVEATPEPTWVIAARTRAGRPFLLQAPGSFTRAQALEVAAGVSAG